MAQVNKQNLKKFLVLSFWMAVVAAGVFFAARINRRVDSIFDTLRLISGSMSEIRSDLSRLNSKIE